MEWANRAADVGLEALHALYLINYVLFVTNLWIFDGTVVQLAFLNGLCWLEVVTECVGLVGYADVKALMLKHSFNSVIQTV